MNGKLKISVSTLMGIVYKPVQNQGPVKYFCYSLSASLNALTTGTGLILNAPQPGFM